MIVRAYRYRVRPGCRAAFEAASGDEGAARAAGAPGLRFALAGRGVADPDTGIVVTGWRDFEAVDALVRDDLLRPALLSAGSSALLAEHEVTHWEALDLPAVGAGAPAILRVMTGHVAPSRDATYFAYVRERVWPRLAGTPGLSGAWVGRQTDGGNAEPVLAVSAWSSTEALRASGGEAAPLYDDHADAGFELDGVELFELFASHVRPPDPSEDAGVPSGEVVAR